MSKLFLLAICLYISEKRADVFGIPRKRGEKSLLRQMYSSSTLASIYPCDSTLSNSSEFINQLQHRRCRIVIWCSADEQINIANWIVQHDLLQRRCIHLFINERTGNFSHLQNHLSLQNALRPDSQMFAFTLEGLSRNHTANSSYVICKFIATGSYSSTGIPCFVTASFTHLQRWKKAHLQHLPLHGYTVKIGTIQLPPVSNIIVKGNTTAYNGYCYVLVNLFAKYLGFRPQFEIEKSGSYGSFKNGSWSGLMGMIQNKKVDTLAVMFSITTPRLIIGDFTPLFGKVSMAAVIRKPETNPKIFQYTVYGKPFPLAIWFLILSTSCLAFVCLVFTALYKHCFQNDDQLSSLKKTISLMLWAVGCLFLQQEVTNLPRIRSGMIIILFYLIFVLIVSKTYYSLITASLTFKHPLGVYNTLEELLDDGKYGIAVKPTASLANIQKAKSGTFARIWTKMQEDSTSIVASDLEGFDKVYNEKFVYITNQDLANKWLKSNCSLVYIKKPLSTGTLHYFMLKNSPFIEAYRRIILSIHSSGILERLEKRHLPKFEPEFDCAADGFVFPTTALHQAVGAFVAYSFGLCLALMAFIVEIFYEKFRMEFYIIETVHH